MAAIATRLAALESNEVVFYDAPPDKRAGAAAASTAQTPLHGTASRVTSQDASGAPVPPYLSGYDLSEGTQRQSHTASPARATRGGTCSLAVPLDLADVSSPVTLTRRTRL